MEARLCNVVSVCPSVTFVDSIKVHLSSKFVDHRVATPFYFFHTKRHVNIQTRIALTSNADVVGRMQLGQKINAITGLHV